MPNRAPLLLPPFSRRSALFGLAFAMAGSVAAGCSSASTDAVPDGNDAQPSPIEPTTVYKNVAYEDNVDALFDVLLPADRDDAGNLATNATSPGAREVDAGTLFGDDELVSLATGLGWIPMLSDAATKMVQQGEAPLRAAINALLDLRAARLRPLVAFRDLTRGDQLTVVDDALTDATVGPLVNVVRVAAMVAYLGAITSDAGLVAVGYPPFEDFADGRAVSGYPRTPAGRLIDVAHEDLNALAAKGQLDDYTFNAMPKVDASLLGGLDANGDLP